MTDIANVASPAINVDYRHPDYNKYSPEWNLITACINGERAIRAGGKLYLPHPASKPEKSDPDGSRYRDYQLRAVFLNATGRTLQSLLGLAFAKPVQIELSGRLKELERDADGKGQPMTQFIRDALALNLSKGRGGIMPVLDGGALIDKEGNVISPTQEQAANQKARFRLFTEDEIINWREKNGKTLLVVLRYEEELDDESGFDRYVRTVWVELRIRDGKAFQRTWFNNNNSEAVSMAAKVPVGLKNTDFIPIMSGGAQMTDLPWAWMGAQNNDSTPDAPPLEPIASLNVKHYQAEADVAEIAHIVGQPTIVVAGLTQTWAKDHLKSGITLGSTEGIKLPEKSTVQLLQAEERNLSLSLAERREKQMAMLGASLVERGQAPKTATEAEFDAKTDNSILSLAAGNVESCINKALEFMGGWLGGASGTVTLNKRYSEAVVDSQALTALMAGVQGGTVRLSDFVRWMMSNGLAGIEGETVEMIEDDLRNQEPLAVMRSTPLDPNAKTTEDDPDADPEADPVTESDLPIAKKKRSAPRTKKTTE